MSRKCLHLLCLVLSMLCITNARRDKTQRMFESRLSTTSNRLALLSNATFTDEMYEAFQRDHPRRNQNADERGRSLQLFRQRLKKVIENGVSEKCTFKIGLNKFSDWTLPELQKLRDVRHPKRNKSGKRNQTTSSEDDDTEIAGPLPVVISMISVPISTSQNPSTSTVTPTFDYTTRASSLDPNAKIVGPIRDQGQCGSCYALTFVTTIEAQYALIYGKSVNMSEQQIVDCSTYDYGCDGGYFTQTFKYLRNNNWYMNSASSYPYKAVVGNCAAKKTNGWSVGNLTYRRLPPGNATAMLQALRLYGPLWISLFVGSYCDENPNYYCPVNATTALTILEAFQGYSGGIFQAQGCHASVYDNNHSLVIVGYGYDPILKIDYWKLRNTWGDEWGEDGYIRIPRGINMCNVESDAYYVTRA